MEQLQDLADDRLINGCVYCGGLADTRDHVPARALLEAPFPENLPVVPACRTCNASYSAHEQYLACFLECVLAGSTDPDRIPTESISRALRRDGALRSRIERSRVEVDGQVVFHPEVDRVQRVVRKLAAGHAAYELSRVVRRPPSTIAWWPLTMMTGEQRTNFDAPHVPCLLGEVGSRGLQRLLMTQVVLEDGSGNRQSVGIFTNDWVEVQEGRYRFLAIDDVEGLKVKLVLSEYLACEVHWLDDVAG